MAHAYHHALSSVRKWGGVPDDYLPIHRWFDQTKGSWTDPRHRAVLHSAFGIALCEQFFGSTVRLSTGRIIPVRWIGEQHVKEDCGFIPSLQDWLGDLPIKRWMRAAARQADVPQEA